MQQTIRLIARLRYVPDSRGTAKPSAAVMHAVVKGNKRSELYTDLKMCPPVLRAMANRVPSSVFG